MDIAYYYLQSNIASPAYLGRTRKECIPINLSFEKGYIEWVMTDANPISVPIQEFSPRRNVEPRIMYFDAFFGFTDWVTEVNAVCRKFVKDCAYITKINEVVALIDQRFTWHKFLQKFEYKLKVVTIENFKSNSFVWYLQQVLKHDQDQLTKHKASVKAILINCKFLKSNESLLSVDIEQLQKQLTRFNELYEEKWIAIMRQHYRQQDENSVYGAINFGKRIKVPWPATLKFLQEKEKENNPAYRRNKMLQARLNVFA